MAADAGYYRQPTIRGDRVVFVCEDDLWTVDTSGGIARRLTVNLGIAAFPCLSPDGRRIAFTGRDDGPSEVYVMDADGGPPERLTFQGSTVRTVGWSKDGRRVLFASNYGRPFNGDVHLHEVSSKGGPSKAIPWGPVREVTFQPNGAGIVIGINSGDPARWKRYRGGTAGTLWIDKTGRGNFEPLLELDGNLAAPMWIGSRIYFLSDHEGHGNLYSCTATGRGLRQHTEHDDYYVRFPATDGKRIVYHAGADLFAFDVRQGEASLLDVRLHSPRTQRSRKFVPAPRWLESADLHPAGHSIACTARGSSYTAALWEGAPTRHSAVEDGRMRLACWLADGKRIVAVTDETGEESIVVVQADGGGTRKRIRKSVGHVKSIEVAPHGERLALTNHRNEIWVVDLKGGTAKLVEKSEWLRIHGMSWSPDGRWLAYDFPDNRTTSTIHLYDAQRGRVHAITRPDFGDFAPSFDPAGKYLYFLSRRIWDPVYDQQYFDLGFPKAVVPCLLTLASDTPSPFSASNRAPRAPRTGPTPAADPSAAGGDGKAKGATRRKGAGPTKGKAKKVPATRIDLDGIEHRVLRFPVPEARYVKILAAPGRALFASWPVEGALGSSWYQTGEPPAKAKLEYWDFDAEKVETLAPKITDFSLSGDKKSLLLRIGNRLRALPSTVKPKTIVAKGQTSRETGWIDLTRLRIAIDPAREWQQMFSEAWRLQRDNFWTEDMASVDWDAVHDLYLPLVERVTTRSEFSDLMWEMQGELGTSHCYELGGDYRPSPRWFQGFLGADLAFDSRTKSWKIARIPRGDSWDSKSFSPLQAPGLGIREGDQILSVDGRAVGADVSPFECLVNQADRDVQLELRSGKKRRTVTVRTLVSELALRYRDFVESNRAFVHKKSRGRIGYVHIPDMGARGFSEFHRYFQQEVDKLGLVIDVRWNGGGHVSQLLLEKLLRRRIGYDSARWSGVESYPADAPMGPMVALTNEYAGSDGDMFSHAFKLYGLGPLLGKRTWGGVVGIWPRHALVDGTVTTQPEFASWFEDVGYDVENYGTDPDIVVENRPQDHKRGRDVQLERALEEVERIVRETKPTQPSL